MQTFVAGGLNECTEPLPGQIMPVGRKRNGTWEHSAQQRVHEPEGLLFIFGDDHEVARDEVHALT